jgi:hypothetical protein
MPTSLDDLLAVESALLAGGNQPELVVRYAGA